MFSNFRFFIVVGFIVMVMLVMTTSMYFRSAFQEELIHYFLTKESRVISVQYANHVYCPTLANHGAEGISLPDFMQNTRLTLGTSSVDAVRLFDSRRNIIFDATSPKYNGHPALPKIFDTVQTPEYITPIVLDTGNVVHWFKFIIPMKPSVCEAELPDNTQHSRLWIEYHYDVTSFVNKIAWLQILMSCGLITVFGILYLLTYIHLKKVEQLLQKQLQKRKGLEAEIHQVSAENEAKSMFLANITHELRTPLNAIIGFSEMMRDEIIGPLGHSQYKEYVNDINLSGTHLLSLINDILDYSKAEAHRLDVEKIDVDLTKIVQNCIRMVQPKSDKNRINIIQDMPKGPVFIKTDPKRIKQVMLNLLSNATKFTPEGKKVVLSVKKHRQDIVISIKDEGIGLAPEDIPKALMPFGQIDNSFSKRYEGTGLGLPLSKKLTEIMGGEFFLTSSVGHGTEITLIFPI